MRDAEVGRVAIAAIVEVARIAVAETVAGIAAVDCAR